MKKIFILFSLCVLPSAFVYSQTEVESVCKSNLENIFKANTLKVKYEAVQYLYHELDIKDSIINNKHCFLSEEDWNQYFLSITGSPMDGFKEPARIERTEEEMNLWKLSSEEMARYIERTRDSISHKKPVPVRKISEEEMYRYIKLLNCTPQKAIKEYIDFIRNIKSEKEIYLKCIDAEIAKGDLSEYANNDMIYGYLPFMQSFIPIMTPLNYLKVFKEFILNDDEEVLPDYTRVRAYLKCGCKI